MSIEANNPELEGLTKQIAKGGGIAFVAGIVGKFLTLLLHILLGRVLGPGTYGLYALGASFASIVQSIASLGLKQGVVRFCAMYRGEGDYAKVKGTIVLALTISLVSSVVVAVTLFIFSDVIARGFFHEPNLTWVLRVFSLALPFYVLMGITTSFAQAFKRIDYQQGIQNIFHPFINLALVGLALLVGWGLAGALYGFLASGIISAGVGFYLLLKIFPGIHTTFKSIYEFRRLLRFSIPVFFSGFLYLTLNNIDRIMLGYLSNVREVGIYSAAASVALMLNVILSAFIPITAPIMAELHNAQRFENLAILYRTVTRWVLTLSLPIFFIFVFASEGIMKVFGPEFGRGGLILVLLAGGQIINVGTGPIGRLLEMSGKQDINLWVVLGVITINIGLNSWLIPLYGAIGAAIATSLSIAVIFGTLAAIIHRILGIHIYNRLILRPLIAGGLSVVIGILLGRIIEFTFLNIAVVEIASILLIYALLILTIGLTPSDWRLITSVKERLMKRHF
jgi:O-antigen/teichoic acid export membrane protein